MVCEGYRDEGVVPTGGLPAFCGSPALGAMGGGLRGLIATRASLLQGDCLHFVGAPPRGDGVFVGAPPSGRWGVVCEGYRDEGVAPTGGLPAFCGSLAPGAMGLS